MTAKECFEAKVYKSSNGKSLNYRMHIPENMDTDKEYPLLLFFHGSGERGDDNIAQLHHGIYNIQRYSITSGTPFFIIVPQCPEGMQWVDTQWSALSHVMPENPALPMKLSIDLMNSVVSNQPIDRKRIYVTGISMGGFAVWDIIQRIPDVFAAAIPVCGGGDTHCAEKIKNVPIWAFHGEQDRSVNTQRSRDMIIAIKKAGGTPFYTEYKGVGHSSWDITYSDKRVMKWLFDQKKI